MSTIDLSTFQLEEGSTATEYELPAPKPDYPIEIESVNDFDVVSSVEKLSEGQLQEYDYGVEYENVDKINLSLSEPLRSVGDVKDRIYKDSDGLWKVERNVGAETLDRNTRLNIRSTHYNGSIATDRWVNPVNSFPLGTRNTATSHFRRVERDEESALWHSEIVGHVSNDTYQFHINFSNNSVGIVASDDSNTRTTKIRDWLQSEFDSGTPVVIQYELATPTIETLDQELQDQLNTLKSFKDSIFVYTVLQDDDLTPTIHAKTEVKDI